MKTIPPPAMWPPALRVPRAAAPLFSAPSRRFRASTEQPVPAGYERDPRFAELDAAIRAEDQRAQRRARRAAGA